MAITGNLAKCFWRKIAPVFCEAKVRISESAPVLTFDDCRNTMVFV